MPMAHICSMHSHSLLIMLCATLNLLAMAMTEPHFRPSSVFIATSMEITCNCALLVSSLFLGLVGVPPCQRNPQIPSFAQTSMPIYDPFHFFFQL